MPNQLFLIDGSSYVFRAYHALPLLTRNSDGLPIGAVAGFCSMLWKLVTVGDQTQHPAAYPTHIAVFFDHKAPGFRKDIYDGYKKTRPLPPEDLKPQFELIRYAVDAFNIVRMEAEGYEADDLIATYARLGQEAGMKVRIIASDKDLMQMINTDITLVDTMKNKCFDPEEVKKKFGVLPHQMVDFQALVGDTSDNVPGVPGIGKVTAAKLLDTYGTLEALLERASDISQKRVRENLQTYADQARLSKRLVQLSSSAPTSFPLEALSCEPICPSDLIGFLKAMELPALVRRFSSHLECDADAIAAREIPVAHWESVSRNPEKEVQWSSEFASLYFHALFKKKPLAPEGYQTLTTPQALTAFCEEAYARGALALSFQMDEPNEDRRTAPLIGLGLSCDLQTSAYVPLAHTDGSAHLSPEEAFSILRPLLHAPACMKIGYNLKEDMHLLRQYDAALTPYDDLMLLVYALGSLPDRLAFERLSRQYLAHTLIARREHVGTGKDRKRFSEVSPESATRYAAEHAEIMLRLWALLKQESVRHHAVTVYETIERPLPSILAQMEAWGILLDLSFLEALTKKFLERAENLRSALKKEVGHSFNPASPKQVSAILYDEMGLAARKKTQGGMAWSTSADVLEELAEQGHKVAHLLLEWRQVMKLCNTYTQVLPEYADPETQRVHTHYLLAHTKTGRLSSEEPNLQNIPIRTAEGRLIRRAFIAPEGSVLVCADYAQIELRLLAHLCGSEALHAAFRRGEDIHARVASEVFGVSLEAVDNALRRRAKAITFGIIYGISAFGLAEQLGIPKGDAKSYIEAYFEKFPAIQAYIEETKKYAYDQGYIKTIFGRKIDAIRLQVEKNPAERRALERAVVNARLQGSAADLIKRAMIKLHQHFSAGKLSGKMLLQIHDELVFETRAEQVADFVRQVKHIMETAHEPACTLTLPLQVVVGSGANWDKAH